MKCLWCEKDAAIETKSTVFWELPDGTQSLEIRETPTIYCSQCQMEYLTDEMTEELEDHLLLINTKQLPGSIYFEKLMEIPRLLKRNYFK